MAELGYLLGSLLAKAVDPVTWLAAAMAAVLAFQQWSAWWLLLVAGAGAAIVGYFVSDNYRLLGLSFDPAQFWFTQTLLIGAWCAPSYGIVYMTRRRAISTLR
jgi:hypothetical protein